MVYEGFSWRAAHSAVFIFLIIVLHRLMFVIYSLIFFFHALSKTTFKNLSQFSKISEEKEQKKLQKAERKLLKAEIN